MQAIAALAQRYPKIGVILDGWVLPDSQVIMKSKLATIWLNKFHRDAIFADLEVARKIADHLPTGTLVANLIGSSMTTSLRRLRNIDAYFSHVGTLQHKISFVSGSQGVVHGPKSQLKSPDSGHFQADRRIRTRVTEFTFCERCCYGLAKRDGVLRLRDHGR